MLIEVNFANALEMLGVSNEVVHRVCKNLTYGITVRIESVVIR